MDTSWQTPESVTRLHLARDKYRRTGPSLANSNRPKSVIWGQSDTLNSLRQCVEMCFKHTSEKNCLELNTPLALQWISVYKINTCYFGASSEIKMREVWAIACSGFHVLISNSGTVAEIKVGQVNVSDNARRCNGNARRRKVFTSWKIMRDW